MKLLAPSDIAGPIFSLAAFTRADFPNILRRLGVTPEVHPIKSFGEVIDVDRSFYLEISPGRHASVSKRDSQSELEIALQRVGYTFFRAELLLVANFIGVLEENVELYRNPPIKWTSLDPTPKERAKWRNRVGSNYPYPSPEA